MKSVKVKYLKSHPKDAYFAGDIANVSAEKAAARHKTGHIIVLPDDEDEGPANTLPEDFPARDILFKVGFYTAEKVKEAGESLTDIKGIGRGTLKQIDLWFENNGPKE